MLAKMTSMMNNSSHPLHETPSATGCFFHHVRRSATVALLNYLITLCYTCVNYIYCIFYCVTNDSVLLSAFIFILEKLGKFS